MKFKYYIFILLLFVMASCKPEIDEFSPSKGNADFTSFLSVGNSLTAGYADGALYKSGQENSFPNILAKQFAYVGGGDFKQPLMVDDYGFGIDGITPVPKFILGPSTDCEGVTSLAPVRAPVAVDPANFASVAAGGPYNNMAVPGVKTTHFFVDQLATLNPYYGRFAPSATTPLINLTASIDATFFTLWVGNNDALGYALAGGAADALTPPAQFAAAYENIVKACIQNMDGAYAPANGALANIPDILAIPYCSFMNTKVPYNGLVLDATQAAGLTAVYDSVGFVFVEGPNPWVVQNSDGSWGRMSANDQFLLSLPTDLMKCSGMGAANMTTFAPYPIPHQYILDEAEITDIRNHVAAYNQSIYDFATTYKLAYVDMAKVLEDAKTGIMLDGITITSTFITGNAFSLDGIHLTPLGNAMAAHYFIEGINSTYSASVPQVLVTDYQAVQFP